jgi:hypothetical protein
MPCVDLLLATFFPILIACRTYKRMEASVQGKRRNLMTKIPELKKALDGVLVFQSKAVSDNRGDRDFHPPV